MKNYKGRYIDLKNRLNNHLQKLTGQDKDFYATLPLGDLMELKTVLADVNNVLTMKMTVSAAEWLSTFFRLSKETHKNLLKEVDLTKPNSKGFDIHINGKQKIIAEVKCNAPVNKGGRYGGAQWNTILDDANKLQNGKGSILDTSKYFKFIFLVDLGERTDNAINHLLKPSKGTSENPLRANRHKIKDRILLLNEKDKASKLSTDKIYIKSIKLK